MFVAEPYFFEFDVAFIEELLNLLSFFASFITEVSFAPDSHYSVVQVFFKEIRYLSL